MIDPPALDWLRMLHGQASGWVEIRWSPGDQKMHREFRRPNDHGINLLAADCMRLSRYGDVFVGIAPRVDNNAGGGQDNVAEAFALWVDCDTPESVKRLADFKPEPSMVVASGSGGNCHAYWQLTAPVPAEWVRRANARLAAAMGADPRCAEPARILRPPGTLNHKHDPATEVKQLWRTETIHPFSFVADLPEVKVERKSSRAPMPVDTDDPLLGISALSYVPIIGKVVEADGRGFTNCPLHEDWNPSLMCYEAPERGWHCFQCGQGGDIYRLGALVFGIPDKGDDFHRLRERLHEAVGSLWV